jgi:hypothetical protein
MIFSNTIIFGLLTGIILLLYFILDKEKTVLGLKKGGKRERILLR